MRCRGHVAPDPQGGRGRRVPTPLEVGPGRRSPRGKSGARSGSQAGPSISSECHARQSRASIRRAREYRNARRREDPVPAFPAVKRSGQVAAHEPDQAGAGQPSPDAVERGVRACGADPSFEIARQNARVAGDRGRAGHAPGEGQHALGLLERILGGYQPPDLVQIQSGERQHADPAMAGVRGIERSAEESDSPAPPADERHAAVQGRTPP